MTEITTLEQTLIFLFINLGYAVLALVVSIVALIAIDKIQIGIGSYFEPKGAR